MPADKVARLKASIAQMKIDAFDDARASLALTPDELKAQGLESPEVIIAKAVRTIHAMTLAWCNSND